MKYSNKTIIIMDYEKCYREALERAKAFDLPEYKNIMTSIFPELAMSDDERIRKALVELVKCNERNGYTLLNNVSTSSMLAWLEKQVSVDEDEVLKGVRRGVAISLINHIDANSKGMYLSNMESEDIENAIVNEDWDKVYNYMKKKLEKQSEKSQDEDEKIRKMLIEFFKDWGKTRSHCWNISIPDILAWLEKQGESYTKRDVDDAYLEGISVAKNELEKQGKQKPNPYSGTSFEYNGHIWGMCARDGGVEILVDGRIKESIFLDNKPQGKSALEAIQEEKEKVFDEKKYVKDWLEKNGGQKPAWSEEDRTMAFTLMRDVDQMSYVSKEGKNERIGWLNSLDEKFASRESSWSEEDEKMLNDIDITFFEEKSIPNVKYWKFMNWIKSLKDRIQH